MKRLFLMLAVLAGAIYVGCKEGEGDRCQVNSDCSSGTCNVAEGICSTSDTGSDDALLPEDAPPADAATDTPIDTP